MKRYVRNFLSVILILSLLLGVMTVYAVEDNTASLAEMPHSAPNGTFDSTYAGTLTVYTESEAREAGIVDGYSGYVVRVQPGSNGAYAGYDFDFTSQKIPVDAVESITFRVYLDTGHTEMRLLSANSSSWVMRAAPSSFGAWSDITLTADGANFQDGKSMQSLADSEGNLGRICLIARLGSGKDKSYYLDSITVKYKDGATSDTTPPVITYNGPSEVTAMVGNPFVPTGVSAYDEFDKIPSALSYEWSAGAVDSLGCLKEGMHTCKIIATDRSGNSSSISITVVAKTDESVINLDSIPYTSYIAGVSCYSGNVTDLTEAQAAAAGVPAGYVGNVMQVTSTNPRFGMTFDPTALNIPVHLIERITFRVYMPTSTNALRISNDGANTWNVLSDLDAKTWVEYTIGKDGTGMANSTKIADLAGPDGDLGIFGIATKSESSEYVFYIDSIVIKLKENDGVGPVISHEGPTDILTSSGKPFEPAISAYDESEERNIELSYSWSDGALDFFGNMVEGEHVCSITAVDYYGNLSEIILNVTVGAPDVSAPVIHFEAKDVYVMAGTVYRLDILATDDYDTVSVVEEWSKTAMDFGGRMIQGEYVLTLTATDLTGNKAVKTVYVHVLGEDFDVGIVV